jgi:hypothetical protein
MADPVLSAPLNEAALSIADRVFYLEIWEETVHQCQCCGTDLFEPLLFMFHHVLEKRVKVHSPHVDYSRFRHCKWNIMLLCWQCHDAYERNPAVGRIATIVLYRDMLIGILEDGVYDFDSEHLWSTDTEVDLSPIQSLFGKTLVKYGTG